MWLDRKARANPRYRGARLESEAARANPDQPFLVGKVERR
jgi:hypothetical protein